MTVFFTGAPGWFRTFIGVVLLVALIVVVVQRLRDD